MNNRWRQEQRQKQGDVPSSPFLLEGALSKLAKKLVLKAINPVKFEPVPGWGPGNERTLKRRYIKFDGTHIGKLYYSYKGFDKRIGRHRYYISWFVMNHKMKGKKLGSHSLETFLGSDAIKHPARVTLHASAQDYLGPDRDEREELLRFYKRVGFRFHYDDSGADIGIIDID
jgi:hypothetical protein